MPFGVFFVQNGCLRIYMDDFWPSIKGLRSAFSRFGSRLNK